MSNISFTFDRIEETNQYKNKNVKVLVLSFGQECEGGVYPMDKLASIERYTYKIKVPSSFRLNVSIHSLFYFLILIIMF